jgi:putative transposase
VRHERLASRPSPSLGDAGNYFITASTLHKQHLFRTPASLDALRESLFAYAQEHDCWLQAWSFFANHYHLVVACNEGENVRRMLTQFHINSAIELNRRDGTSGRKVWFQFRDLQLTIPASWLARLRYTHENAVHHGLVLDAANYRWCSASWFADRAPRAFVETVRRVKIDRVNVYDAF